MNDAIILRFEVESNLKDTADTMKLSSEVAQFVMGFKGIKLQNIGVEYKWNEQQEVKQSDEFLKVNPNYHKENEEWRQQRYKKSMKQAEPQEKDNGKFTGKEFKEYVDNPNKG